MPRKKRDPAMSHRHRREPKLYPCKTCGEPTPGIRCDACRAPDAQSSAPASTAPPEDRSAGTGQRGRRDRLEIVLPWETLISDNERHGVMGGRIMLTRAYRKAKKAQKEEAKRQVPHPWPHLKGRVRLTARVWFPDTEVRDITNLAKCTHDSLEGICFAKDAQIKDVRWIDAGVDPIRPRCELTVEVYVQDHSEQEAA